MAGTDRQSLDEILHRTALWESRCTSGERKSLQIANCSGWKKVGNEMKDETKKAINFLRQE